MLRIRPAISVLISAATATLGVAIGPAGAAMAAGAVTDTITISFAGSTQDNPGLLTIDVQSSTDIASLTAQLVPAVGSPVDVSTLHLISGTLTNGEWQVPSALTLPALGDYAVDVTAADTGGGALTGFAAGILHYAVLPTITMSTSPNPVDFDHRTVTFSGLLTGKNPDGTSGPVAGQEVDIVNASTDAVLTTTTTAGDGTYQVDAVPVPQDPYWALVPASGTIFAGNSGIEYIDSTIDPVSLTAHVSATKVKYKQSVIITGTATYLPVGGSVYQPLPDSAVVVYGGSSLVASTTTASDGTFSVSIQMFSTGQFQVYAGGIPQTWPADNLLQQAEVNLPTITVALPVQLTGFSAKVDAFGVLTVKGCLSITTQSYAQGLPLQVEYSTKATGPWTVLGTLRHPLTGNQCAGVGRDQFLGKLPVKYAWAYYRVHWTGNASFQPATSKAVLAGRYLTRITSLKVSATNVARNANLTVSGQLWQYTRAWHPYSQRRVLIVLRPKGSSKWYWIVKVLTNSTGHFRATFKDPVSATWSAVYEGDSTHYASGGKLIYVSTSAGLPGGVRLAGLGPLAPAGADGAIMAGFLVRGAW